MRKSTVLIAAATAILIGLVSIAVAWWGVRGGRSAAPSVSSPGIVAAAPAGGPFTMVDHTGRTLLGASPLLRAERCGKQVVYAPLDDRVRCIVVDLAHHVLPDAEGEGEG